MHTKKTISLKNKKIGGDNPCFIIAEVGPNHNNDYALALQHIDAAAEAGVDAVKFQTFKAENHFSKYTPVIDTHANMKNVHIYDLVKSLEMDRNWHEPLKNYAESKGLVFFTTACDYEAVEQVEALDVELYKIASFDLPDTKLLSYIAKKHKPMILSTGLTKNADLELAVNTIRAEGNDRIILLQCTSLYPAPCHLSNLNAMPNMSKNYDVVVGYSDHTMGEHICLASVAMGAKVIEKHFTLDRKLPGPDHCFCIEPAELKDMVKHIRDVESALGDGIKNGPRPEEQENYEKASRSVHVNKDVKAGYQIKPEDLIVKRPSYGVKPADIEKLIGLTLTQDVSADHWITWEDFK